MEVEELGDLTLARDLGEKKSDHCIQEINSMLTSREQSGHTDFKFYSNFTFFARNCSLDLRPAT